MAAYQTNAKNAAPNGVPTYVLEHAPLLYLHSKDPYRPSSIAAQLTNTHPEVNFKPIAVPNPPLRLDRLDQLNNVGGENVYLTSNEDATTNPAWLEGQKTYGNEDDKTGVVVVVDKGEGVVDAFYFYFWAFNWGGIVLGKQLGDHVGDWEHNMIRFINGVPKYIWLSQHSNGEAFTFEALTKDASGKRPLIFASTGSHALYAIPGTHDHTIPNFNLDVPLLLIDETDKGSLYDPLTTSYFYRYNPTTSTFTPYNATDPTAFLYFKGRWGDAEYPADDPRQKDKGLLGFKKYGGGPTGVGDKYVHPISISNK
ncbi:hypothetical protein CC86DRAFT_75920 [Ophiobolus disseminans]|uniref:Vacuolar protein sorting-associated protein 62 n=1 Tax=Ophiobolus disseminans TaxID=1469910 RepID=A0A6A6ZPQ5_9PLEO|nr:hypothetical protein CC86DRAFT_75920 [Ophiobolus disseminans]